MGRGFPEELPDALAGVLKAPGKVREDQRGQSQEQGKDGNEGRHDPPGPGSIHSSMMTGGGFRGPSRMFEAFRRVRCLAHSNPYSPASPMFLPLPWLKNVSGEWLDPGAFSGVF